MTHKAWRGIFVTLTAMAIAFAAVQVSFAGSKPPAAPADPCPGGLEPNLQAVVPHHLGVQNTQQREYLRLANGIANVSGGPWHLHPETDVASEGGTTTAIQDIWSTQGGVSDPASRIVCSIPTTQFEFHPAHNHWHIGSVALFAVHRAADDGRGGRFGPVYVNNLGVAQSFKTTFCLIDWVKIEDNTRTPERTFFECDRDAPYQGVSVGWIDQYHHSLEGQEIDFTGAPTGVYYLMVDVNDDRVFLESNYSDNLSWVSFRLTRDSKGNAKIATISRSACSSPNMCGEALPNR